MTALFARLTSTVVPIWARWAAIAALVVAGYGMGRLQEARHDAAVHEVAATKAAAVVVKIVTKQVEGITKTETVYRDRIQKIYVQEQQLEAHIPDYIPPAVDRDFAVPAGFVRLASAGWSGTAAGPAAESDKEPSGVPFSELAAIEVGNATSCRIWREQALGWRDFYAGQQVAINGKVGDWYRAPDGPDRTPLD